MLLVDTNVISELMRPRPDARVVGWAKMQSAFAVSVVTIEEVLFGLAVRPSARLARWFEEFVAGYCQVLPVIEPIARCASVLRAGLRKQGLQRTQADMLIAATALEHRLTLATRNVRDFAGCGIQLLDPFHM